MASAVIASTNESHWGDKVYIRNYANSSANISHFSNFNPNPSHVPNRQIGNPSLSNSWQNEEPPARNAPAVPSDDFSSHKRRPNVLTNRKESSHREFLTFNLAKSSRAELKELKRRLRSELDQVRRLRAQIESLDVEHRSGHPGSRPPPLQVEQPSDSKEKLTPKAHQPPTEFLSSKIKAATPRNSKKASGHKRAFPFASNKDPKRQATVNSHGGKIVTSIMMRCAQILGKLMKHKHAWVFNTPVDVVGLGLHDYYQIIKHPMDLGTVKSRLNKNEYASALDFASDVRLTFNNAMTYNPKGQDVHVMAATLLALFEKMFNPAYKKFEAENRRVLAAEEMNNRVWAPMEELVLKVDNVRIPLPEAIVVAKKSDSMCVQGTLPNQSSVQVEAAPTLPEPNAGPVTVPRSTPKLPKPKAKDPNKRLMNFEEKAKLGMSLQSLPSNKMEAMLAIISKRNSQMAPEGDEIELDFEALDNETLWELDRFVSNHKKAESKMKRQDLFKNAATAAQIDKSPAWEPTTETEACAQKSKKVDNGEEDVDIGEDIPLNNYPPVEIEKDANCTSDRSSSSSSSSNSSSDSSSSSSDSGDSSGSDSDEDSVQSPFIEPKGGGPVT